MTRVVIDEAKFRELVAGRVASCGNVEIILADISLSRMIDAIISAVVEPHANPPDPPQAREFLPASPARQRGRK